MDNRRTRAFEDIFARPVARNAPQSRRPPQQHPSQLQMTPQIDYAYQEQMQYRAASNGHGYPQGMPPQPASNRASVYAMPNGQQAYANYGPSNGNGYIAQAPGGPRPMQSGSPMQRGTEPGYAEAGPSRLSSSQASLSQAQIYAEAQQQRLALQRSQHSTYDQSLDARSASSSVYSPSTGGDRSPTFSTPSSLSTYPTSAGQHALETNGNDDLSQEASDTLQPYPNNPMDASNRRRKSNSRNPSHDLTRDPQLSAYFTKAVERPSSSSNNSAKPKSISPPSTAGGRPSSSRYEYSPGSSSQGYDDPRSSESGHYAPLEPAAHDHLGRGYFDEATYRATPNDPYRQSVDIDRASYFSQPPRAPEGPRPLPTSADLSYSQSSASARPYSIYSDASLQGPEHADFAYQQQVYYQQQQYNEALKRNSSESSYSPMQQRAASLYNDRSSMSTMNERNHHRRISQPSLPSMPSAVVTATRKAPIVYPALLSRVAEAFKTRVLLTERVKDGLTYKDAFDGREAVDRIAYIIKTTDRNLALLLGRALDSQKFFHDVTYDHRLRDSSHELYQFRETLAFVSSDNINESEPVTRQSSSNAGYLPTSHYQRPTSFNGRPPSISETILSDDTSVPSGVFTLLTDCYSPTCTRDKLCYSIACPRRLEQQARLKLKPQPGLQRSASVESLGGDRIDLREPGALWIESVPQEVRDSVSESEMKRQEVINEAIATERDFLRDVEYLRDTWIKDIRASPVIPDTRKEDFITQVFWNLLDIHTVALKLCEQLSRRQKAAHVVERIGDIFLDNVGNFAPFVVYGAHQMFGKYEFEKEKGSNPAFAKFVEDLERAPESRKLELNGYLTKPTTRLARYPLLLEAILKNTPEDHPDQQMLPKAVKIVREFLTKVNEETGKSENRFNLAQLDQQLVFRPNEAVDLKLREESRELILKGPMKKRGGTQSESAELQVFLFDHALLMVKEKTKNQQYKVYRKPIPLELLIVSTAEETVSTRGATVRPKSIMSRNASTGKLLSSSVVPPPPVAGNNKQGFAMTFTHLGRKGYNITLWATTYAGQKNWLEKIEQRQAILRERSMVFDTALLSEGYFVGSNRATCAAPFDSGNRLVFGTDNGVFVCDLRDRSRVPIKVISVANVTQVEVLDEYGILIVLADKAVQTFYIDNLDPQDSVGAAKRAKKISSNATFFKAGLCMGRTLVCIVKSSSVSSTIKTMEPIEQQTRGKKQPGIRKFLQANHDHLRVYKEFYLPSSADSIHFLKSKLCVGCAKGFEIVDLETLDTQGLLDPADSSLDFVQKRENVRPIAIYRIDGEFLLCYDEFAFYVNKNGWRTKSNWLVQWEGHPNAFALYYPYVIAFEPSFVEVRHVDTGSLMQIIPGHNLKCLFTDTPASSAFSSMQAYQTPGGYPQASPFMPQYARHSTYGSQQPLNFRMPVKAPQILFLDNSHQVYKVEAAINM